MSKSFRLYNSKPNRSLWLASASLMYLPRKLRKSKEQYQLIVENVKELVVKVDASGRFIYVSPTYCEMFGKTEQELIGQPYLPLVPEEDRAETIKMSKQLRQPPF